MKQTLIFNWNAKFINGEHTQVTNINNKMIL